MVRFKSDNAVASGESVNEAVIQNGNEKLKIYPNPVGDLLHITGLDPNSKAEILLTDNTGKVLKRLSTNKINSITINVRSLATGAYYLIIQKENEHASYKFIKR